MRVGIDLDVVRLPLSLFPQEIFTGPGWAVPSMSHLTSSAEFQLILVADLERCATNVDSFPEVDFLTIAVCFLDNDITVFVEVCTILVSFDLCWDHHLSAKACKIFVKQIVIESSVFSIERAKNSYFHGVGIMIS